MSARQGDGGLKPSLVRRTRDRLLTRLVRRGKGPEFMWLLTVTGRRTGQAHTTPVVPVRHDDAVWLVSPYGDVNWVRNARAAGEVELSRGDHHIRYRARELQSGEAVPVIREYLSMPSERFIRKDFAVTAAGTDDAIAGEAPRHPVFKLVPVP